MDTPKPLDPGHGSSTSTRDVHFVTTVFSGRVSITEQVDDTNDVLEKYFALEFLWHLAIVTVLW